MALPEGVKAGDPVPFKPGFVYGASGDYVDTRYSGVRLSPNEPGGANNPISESEAMRRYGTTFGVNVSGVPTKPYVEGHDSNQIPTTPEDLAFTLRTRGDDPNVQRYARENPTTTDLARRINESFKPVEVEISNPRRVNPGPRYETTTTTGQRIVLSSGPGGEISVLGTQEAVSSSSERLSDLGLGNQNAHLLGTKAGEPGTVGGIPFTPKSEFGVELEKGGVVQFFEQKEGLNFTPASPYGFSTRAGITQLRYSSVASSPFSMGESEFKEKFPSTFAVSKFLTGIEKPLIEASTRSPLNLLGQFEQTRGLSQKLSEFGVPFAIQTAGLPAYLGATVADFLSVPSGKTGVAALDYSGRTFIDYNLANRSAQGAVLLAGYAVSKLPGGQKILMGGVALLGAGEVLEARQDERLRAAGRLAGNVASLSVFPRLVENFAKSRIRVSQGASEARVLDSSEIFLRTRKIQAGARSYSDKLLDVKQVGYAESAAAARDRLGNLYTSQVKTTFQTFTGTNKETIFFTSGFAYERATGVKAFVARVGGIENAGTYRFVSSSGRLLPFERGGPYQVFTENVVTGQPKTYSTGYAYEGLTQKGYYEFFPSGQMVAPASQVTRYPFERTVFTNLEVAGPYGFDVTGAQTRVKTLGVFERLGKPSGDLDLSRLGSFVPDVVSGAFRTTQPRELYPPGAGGGVGFASIVPLKGKTPFVYAGLETQAQAQTGAVILGVSGLAQEAALTSVRTSGRALSQGVSLSSLGVRFPPIQEGRGLVVSDSRTVLIERQAILPDSVVLPSSDLMPSSDFVSRSLITQRQIQTPRTVQMPDLGLLPDSILMPRTEILTRTQTLNRTVGIPSELGARGIEPVPIIEIPKYPFGGGDLPGGFFGFDERPFKKGKRGYRYAPSLTAIVFDIRAASFPKVAFGEAVRPIVSAKRRGTKPFFGGFDFL